MVLSLGVLLGVATAAAVLLLVRLARVRGERAAAIRDAESSRREAEQLRQEIQHLAQSRVPALVDQLSHAHVPVPDRLYAEHAGTPEDAALSSVLDQVTRAVEDLRTRADAAGQAVVRAVTTDTQALSYRMQDMLGELQEACDDPRVFKLAIELDRLNERIRRRWQAVGIACGASPRLIRRDSHLPDLVVGAQSRIDGYDRVQVHNHLRADRPLGVAAHAAEPVAVIVAELLDNACFYSAGTVGVQVQIHEVPTGAVVVIEDAGTGMHEEETALAQRMLLGQQRLLLTDLGDPPRMGMAVIGQLLRGLPIKVSFGVSGYQGTRVTVHLPTDLLTVIDVETRPMAAASPLPASRPGESGNDQLTSAAFGSGTLDPPLPRREPPERVAGGERPAVPARGQEAADHGPTTRSSGGAAGHGAAEPAQGGETPGSGGEGAVTRGTASAGDEPVLPRRRRQQPAARPQTPSSGVMRQERTPEEMRQRYGALHRRSPHRDTTEDNPSSGDTP